MIRIDCNPAWWNEVANTPGIKEWVDAGLERVDVSPLFEHDDAIGVRTKHGGFILIPKPFKVWEPHGFFPKQPNRLNAAIQDAEDLMKFAFLGLGAWMLKIEVDLTSATHGTGRLLEASGFQTDYDGNETVTYRLTRGQYLARPRSKA